jgi:hypothetical protein
MIFSGSQTEMTHTIFLLLLKLRLNRKHKVGQAKRRQRAGKSAIHWLGTRVNSSRCFTTLSPQQSVPKHTQKCGHLPTI